MNNNLVHFNPFCNISSTEPMKKMEGMMQLMPMKRMEEMMQLMPMKSMEEMMRGMPSWAALGAEPRIKMDINETEKFYTVRADIPGVNKEDIKVMIDGCKVSICAEINKELKEKKEGDMCCSERYCGEQYRSFTLSHDIDDKKAKAKYNNGVLELTLPKKASSARKQLTIN